jgi:preprotein translocase subunit SecD
MGIAKVIVRAACGRRSRCGACFPFADFVSANILIFARMKEELHRGRGLSVAIQEGFTRAWPSIRDSNLNSLIVCAILFMFSTSFIKGFALTLAIGILVSLFSAIFITRIFLQVFMGSKIEKLKWLL